MKMETQIIPLIEKARIFSIEAHRSVNHTYDGKPYETHLELVYEAGLQFIHLIPEKYRDAVLAACWSHDTIEDCRKTYNDVRKALNELVAELTYAVTNEKGKTRKERANHKYYNDIRNTPFATYVKLCDRIANMKYSKQSGSSMHDTYKKELGEFVAQLYDPKYQEMFDYLKTI